MGLLRILIADDHPMFRHGLHNLLDSVADMQVVAEATTGDEAVAIAAQLYPDVVLMDLQMPGGISGIDATSRIRQVSSATRILVVTMYEDEPSVFGAMRAGASGYIVKGAGPTEMLRAIAAVGAGEAIFSPAIALKIIAFFATPTSSTPPQPFPELTDREQEILELIAQGRNNSEIAQRRDLSVKTVSNYISLIFNKLQVADRAQAIIRARDAGLG